MQRFRLVGNILISLFVLNFSSAFTNRYNQDVPLETIARFKGKDDAFSKFIINKIRVPSEMYKKYPHIDTQVKVKFVVTKDGKVENVEVDPSSKNVDPVLQNAAITVIQKTSGKWEPATQLGKAVRIQMSVPITFKW
ncbi:MAG: TonB family protein [Bacteroidetes bacterium]|nr:TonB family protein [Bacteroidota bacterium]